VWSTSKKGHQKGRMTNTSAALRRLGELTKSRARSPTNLGQHVSFLFALRFRCRPSSNTCSRRSTSARQTWDTPVPRLLEATFSFAKAGFAKTVVVALRPILALRPVCPRRSRAGWRVVTLVTNVTPPTLQTLKKTKLMMCCYTSLVVFF
jgi:hypothetical protein